MTRPVSYLLSLATVLWISAGPALAQDPVKVGPAIYKQLFENERIRVLEAQFKPGAKLDKHSHPDHVVYVLAGGTLRVTGADGKAADLNIKTGQTVWLTAQSHSAVNSGKTKVRLLVTELKEPAKK